MENNQGISAWIPLLSKLVWPFITLVLLVIFHREASEVYSVVLNSMKAGRSVEIGGFLKLGEAADKTEIGTLSHEDISIKGIGGASGVTRKGGRSDLARLQNELRENPSKKINTLLLPDGKTYSVDLLKQYVGTLGLRFVLFQRRGKFDGWMPASTFVAQLPDHLPQREEPIGYSQLKNGMIGVSPQSVNPDGSAKEVLAKMQELHIDSIPVVDTNGYWLFFASREEILASLMSTIILESEE